MSLWVRNMNVLKTNTFWGCLSAATGAATVFLLAISQTYPAIWGKLSEHVQIIIFLTVLLLGTISAAAKAIAAYLTPEKTQ